MHTAKLKGLVTDDFTNTGQKLLRKVKKLNLISYLESFKVFNCFSWVTAYMVFHFY